MPSLHVGWAVLVGLTVVMVSTSRWRWLVLAHPVLTLIVVAATANHWWLDGVVAVAILAAAAVLDRRVTDVLRSRRPTLDLVDASDSVGRPDDQPDDRSAVSTGS